jgi:hypothetical protein
MDCSRGASDPSFSSHWLRNRRHHFGGVLVTLFRTAILCVLNIRCYCWRYFCLSRKKRSFSAGQKMMWLTSTRLGTMVLAIDPDQMRRAPWN